MRHAHRRSRRSSRSRRVGQRAQAQQRSRCSWRSRRAGAAGAAATVAARRSKRSTHIDAAGAAAQRLSYVRRYTGLTRNLALLAPVQRWRRGRHGGDRLRHYPARPVPRWQQGRHGVPRPMHTLLLYSRYHVAAAGPAESHAESHAASQAESPAEAERWWIPNPLWTSGVRTDPGVLGVKLMTLGRVVVDPRPGSNTGVWRRAGPRTARCHGSPEHV